MQTYIGIALIIFVAAVIAYLRSTKESEESAEDSGRDRRYLIAMGGMYRGQSFPIGREIVIGRDAAKCGIIYPNTAKGVSSVHCKVMMEEERVALLDLGSTYGTFRDNGDKLSPNIKYYLEPGDGFYLGDAENTFVLK